MAQAIPTFRRRRLPRLGGVGAVEARQRAVGSHAYGTELTRSPRAVSQSSRPPSPPGDRRQPPRRGRSFGVVAGAGAAASLPAKSLAPASPPPPAPPPASRGRACKACRRWPQPISGSASGPLRAAALSFEGHLRAVGRPHAPTPLRAWRTMRSVDPVVHLGGASSAVRPPRSPKLRRAVEPVLSTRARRPARRRQPPISSTVRRRGRLRPRAARRPPFE